MRIDITSDEAAALAERIFDFMEKIDPQVTIPWAALPDCEKEFYRQVAQFAAADILATVRAKISAELARRQAEAARLTTKGKTNDA